MENTSVMNEIIAEESSTLSLWDRVKTSDPVVDIIFAVGGAVASVLLWEGAGAAKNAIVAKMNEKAAPAQAAQQPKTEAKTEQAQTQQATQQQAQAAQQGQQAQ